MKIFNTVVIGSGFSSFILNQILKKKHQIITTDLKYLKSYPERKNLIKHLKLFTKRYSSHGEYQYIFKKSILHDTLLHGGNTNFWGGICNIKNISKYSNSFKKNFYFKKISFGNTGSFSTNKNLFQLQKIGTNNGNIFNCSDYFTNLIKGHLVNFSLVKKNLICLKIKKKKLKIIFAIT